MDHAEQLKQKLVEKLESILNKSKPCEMDLEKGVKLLFQIKALEDVIGNPIGAQKE